jgi:hypothetical protein
MRQPGDARARQLPACAAARFRRAFPTQLSIEEVFPPLIVATSHQPHDVSGSMEIERSRLSHQFHPRFSRELISLPPIARMAASDKILPGRRPSPRTRNHVIQRQLARGQHRRAVLARIAIAQQDVLARERTALMWNPPILEQPNHRRQPHRHPRRVQEVPILFLRHSHALQHKHQRPPRRAHIDRLVRGV